MDELKCSPDSLERDSSAELLHELPDEELLCELAEFFRVFGDSTRMRILYALAHSEKCVCRLSEELGASQSAVSHQLKILRASRLVKYRREGKTVFYSLDDEHIFSILNIGIEHLEEGQRA